MLKKSAVNGILKGRVMLLFYGVTVEVSGLLRLRNKNGPAAGTQQFKTADSQKSIPIGGEL